MTEILPIPQPPAPPLALVSGIASGIGLATARRLRAEGWRVAGLDISAAPEDLDLAGHIRADLSRPAEIDGVIEAARALRPTAFVHAAGLMRADSHPDLVQDAGAALWTLHVGAPGHIARALAEDMPDGLGRLLFLSSRAAQGRAGRSIYAASKAALDGLARSLAAEFVTRGITANVVAPAATDTPQLRDPERATAPVRPLPFGRIIRPEEVAATLAFLASPMAGAITGQTITQCGGASLSGL